MRKLHIDPKTRKAKAQIYFSLETDDKALACKKADAEPRRLDAFWQRHREGGEGFADPAISLARLKAAGLSPGEARAVDDEGVSFPQIDDFREALVGFGEQGESPALLSAQDKLTLEITGNKIINYLRRSEANEYVSRLIEKGQSAETMRKYIEQISPVLR